MSHMKSSTSQESAVVRRVDTANTESLIKFHKSYESVPQCTTKTLFLLQEVLSLTQPQTPRKYLPPLV